MNIEYVKFKKRSFISRYLLIFLIVVIFIFDTPFIVKQEDELLQLPLIPTITQDKKIGATSYQSPPIIQKVAVPAEPPIKITKKKEIKNQIISHDTEQHEIAQIQVSLETPPQADFKIQTFIPITQGTHCDPIQKLMPLPPDRSKKLTAYSNDVAWKDVWNGLKSSFHVPWKELYTRKGNSELENFFSEFGCGASIGFALKKSKSHPITNASVAVRGPLPMNKSAVGIGFRYVPLTNWYASISFSYLLQPELKAPWDPDFTYAFGYNDWHPFTLSLEYSNYGGNRIFPDRANGERRTHFNQGSFTLGWKFILPKKIERHFKIFKSSGLSGGLAWQFSPEFGMGQKNKHTLSLGIKYDIYKYFFFSCNLNCYPKPEQQMDWDPDFTYAFGWSDWHPGTIAITYSNYAPNSYPWKKNRGGSFFDGGISISFSCDFSFLF